MFCTGLAVNVTIGTTRYINTYHVSITIDTFAILLNEYVFILPITVSFSGYVDCRYELRHRASTIVHGHDAHRKWLHLAVAVFRSYAVRFAHKFVVGCIYAITKTNESTYELKICILHATDTKHIGRYRKPNADFYEILLSIRTAAAAAQRFKIYITYGSGSLNKQHTQCAYRMVEQSAYAIFEMQK